MTTKQTTPTDLEVNPRTRTVSAVFATLATPDADRDVLVPGFLKSHDVVISAYGHGSWQPGLTMLPVGRGSVREVGLTAVLEGTFFDTFAGRETFDTVKALTDLQQWSFSLREIIGHRGELQGKQVRFITSCKVHEVSPVLVGAGVNTRTIAAKASDLPTARHLAAADQLMLEAAQRRLADLDAADELRREYERFVLTSARRHLTAA